MSEQQSERKRQAAITKVYDKLHEGKIGAHWLWCVIEQVASGHSEEDAMREFGYYSRAALSKPSTEQGWRTIESAPMHQVVLVAVQGGHVSIGSRAPGIGWFWEPTDEESDDSCVTHWMPLPPPPIEPREEKL